MKMNHVGISVTNLERSVEFYGEMLGMELACPIFPFGGPSFEQIMALQNVQGRMCVVRNGTVQLELFEFSHPNPAPKDPNHSVGDRGISHFGVVVPDIAAAYRRLLAAGVKIHSPVMQFSSGMKAIYARDLDGNVFELLQEPAPSGEST